MATEYKLSYTASEINRKLATVDETKSSLENDYYTSTEVDTKINEANTALGTSIGSSLVTSLANKADLADGKIVAEQLPDDIVNSSDLNDYYTKTEIDEVNEGFEGQFSTKADLVDGKVPVEQLPDDIGGGVTSWNDLEDKPFGETGFKIEWDGNVSNVPPCPVDGSGLTFYKVSDKFISQSDIADASIGVLSNTYNITGDMIFPYESGSFAVIVDGSIPVLIGIAQPETLELFGLSGAFTEAGLWFVKADDESFWLEFVEKDYEIKKIDKTYIPSEIGTWAGMPDKPFGETGFKIEWDGDTAGKEHLSVIDGFDFYRMSSDILTADELIGMSTKIYFDGDDIEGIISQDGDITPMQTLGGNLVVMYYGQSPMFMIASQAGEDNFMGMTFSVPSTGIWFFHGEGEKEYTHYLQKDYGFKTLDEEFIPDTIARKSDIPVIDLSEKADLVDGKVPLEQLPDNIGSGGGVTSWNDLADKPFYEEGLQIVWDGTSTEYEPIDVRDTLGCMCYKVGEKIEKDDIIGCTITMSEDFDPIVVDSSMIIDFNDKTFAVMYNSNTPVLFVASERNTVDLSIFGLVGQTLEVPFDGLWFYLFNDGLFTKSILSPNYEIKQIDKKFLPDDIGGSNGVTSWNDLTDKPFGESGWSIEWDGTPTDEFFDVTDTMGAILYKVGESKTKEELIGATCKYNTFDPLETIEYIIASSDIMDTDSENCFVIFHDGATGIAVSVLIDGSYNFMGINFTLTKGIWFIKSSDYTPIYLGDKEIKQIDPKFIPSVETVSQDCPYYSGGQILDTNSMMIVNYLDLIASTDGNHQLDISAGIYDITTNNFSLTFNSGMGITSDSDIVINIATDFPEGITDISDYISDISVELQGIKELKRNTWYTIYCAYNKIQNKWFGYSTAASADVDTSKFQTKANLVTYINEYSTDEQYPSAKTIYGLIGDCNSVISEINALIGE